VFSFSFFRFYKNASHFSQVGDLNPPAPKLKFSFLLFVLNKYKNTSNALA